MIRMENPTKHQIHSWIWFVLGATSPMVPCENSAKTGGPLAKFEDPS